jgi:tetratricopeptide (TPR) repeat protein
MGARMPAEEHFERGNAYFKQGKYKEAIEEYEKALKVQPKDYPAWINMGLAYRRLSEPNKAIECYQKALEINPEIAEAWVGIGCAYGGLGEFNKAIECYQNALKINPTLEDEELWTGMGVVYAQLAIRHLPASENRIVELNKAIKCLQMAIKINPKAKTAWAGIAVAYRMLGEHDKASECSQEAERLKAASKE